MNELNDCIVLLYTENCHLSDFKIISDNNVYRYNTDLNKFVKSDYSIGELKMLINNPENMTIVKKDIKYLEYNSKELLELINSLYQNMLTFQ